MPFPTLTGSCLRLVAAVALLVPAAAQAQVCTMPEAVRVALPVEAAPGQPYSPRWVYGAEGAEVALGVGHLMYSERNWSADRPPGDGDWLDEVELPLSLAPGEPPFGWIAGGWIAVEGEEAVALARESVVETGYEEASFLVSEVGPNEWYRISYAGADGSVGGAWTPACALDEGPVLFDYFDWSDWLLSDRISPLFFRTETPGPVFGAPSDGAVAETGIGADYHLEPLEVQGDWMRVRIKEPSDYCEFDIEVSEREGWIRWIEPVAGPVVWYYTRGC